MVGIFGYIYVIENDINNKLYVGQTVDPYKRESYHFSRNSFNKNCLTVHYAIKKYGRSNFDFVLLERCDSKQELDAREIYWIKELNTLVPNGYNRTPGGSTSGMWGRKHSPETITRMSECRRGNKNPNFGKKQSEELKIKRGIYKTGEENHRYGTKASPETLKKLVASHKGIFPSQETREKMSIASKGENNQKPGKR